MQLARPGLVVADATRDNTIQATRIVLGWAKNVSGREGMPDLRWLFDGDMLATSVSWGGKTRLVGVAEQQPHVANTVCLAGTKSRLL